MALTNIKQCFCNFFLGLSKPSILDLVQIILNIIEDESSMAARQGLLALQICLSRLLLSAHSDICISILLKLLPVTTNPYWLVKVSIFHTSVPQTALSNDGMYRWEPIVGY